MGEEDYKVETKKKVLKGLLKLPRNTQETFKALVLDLKEFGPIQKGWPNFSALGKDRYHCHLSGSYVACWSCEKNTKVIEVCYVGSREDAPY